MAKTSLSELEARFQRVLDTLRAPVSGRWAISEAGMFLGELPVGRPEAEAYLLPMMKPLAERAEALDPVGLSPDTLGRAAARLRRARQTHRPLRESTEAERAERALRRRAGLLCGYAGAVRRAVSCLHPSSGKAAEAGQPAPGGEPETSGWLEDCSRAAPKERLEEAAKQFSSTEVKEEIKWVLGYWDFEEGPAEESSTRVPVVERPPSWTQAGGTEEIKAGGLRRLDLRILGPAEKTDRLRAEALENSLEGQEEGLAGSPVAAARKALSQRHSSLRGKHLEGRLKSGQTGLRHEGQSAGLAVATLFYGAALRHRRLRRRLRVRREVLITGEVAEGGEVRPVSAEGLPAKVQAAFFSPKTRLVVPEDQQEAAERARDELLEEFQQGELEISGAGHLDDVLSDRRLTRVRRIGRVRHAAQRLWDRRVEAGAGMAIFVLLIVIAALLYGPLDKNPVTVGFGGEEMRLKNRAGQVVGRVSVGPETVQQAQPPDERYRAYALHDLTGDGQNEICWAQRTYQDPNAGPFVACRAVGSEAPLWRKALTLGVSFPEKPAVQADAFNPTGLLVGDHDGNGRPELYLTARHNPYFPGLLYQLDATTGEEMGRYVHPGHLYAGPVALDLGRDSSAEEGPTESTRGASGQRESNLGESNLGESNSSGSDVSDPGENVAEILVGGTSNAYGQAVLAVLDPRDIGGHGPVTEEYRVSGMDRASERAYLRFPLTKVAKAQSKRQPRVREIRHRPASGRIWIEVTDGVNLTAAGKNTSFLLVHLGRDLHPKAVGTSNGYDRLADSLARSGVIGAAPGVGDFEDYRERIRYCLGTVLKMKPTLNSRSRKSKK